MFKMQTDNHNFKNVTTDKKLYPEKNEFELLNSKSNIS